MYVLQTIQRTTHFIFFSSVISLPKAQESDTNNKRNNTKCDTKYNIQSQIRTSSIRFSNYITHNATYSNINNNKYIMKQIYAIRSQINHTV